MKIIRTILWLLVAAVTLGYGYFYLFGSAEHGSQQAAIKIGGSFELIDQNGAPISDKDIIGKPHAMFFGFTHCPEICPATLFEASGWGIHNGSHCDRLPV